LIDEEQLMDHLATPEGAMAIWKEGLTPDILPQAEENARYLLKMVIDWIEEYREPPSVEVIEKETGLFQFNVPIAPVDYIIGRLRKRYLRRETSRITDRVDIIASDPTADPRNALSYLLEEGQRLHLETSSKKGVVSSDDLFGTLDDYHRKLEDGGEQGVTFGFPPLDDYMGGLKVDELTILLARPKRYKSWLQLKSAAEALRRNKNVAFATLELSEIAMRNRFHCMMAGVSWPKFQNGTLRQEDLEWMDEVAHHLHEHPAKCYFFRPLPGERNVANLVNHALDKKADVLYIDQLSWMDGARDERAWQKIGEIMEQLKDATRNFPIYMAAQLNREAVADEGIADISKAGLADFIGQTADNLLAIWASKDMMKSTPRLIHLGISDARDYEPKTWEILVELNKQSDFKCLGELDD